MDYIIFRALEIAKMKCAAGVSAARHPRASIGSAHRL